MYRKISFLGLGLSLLSILVACGGGDAPAPEPAPTDVAVVAVIEPTALPPTATVQPTLPPPVVAEPAAAATAVPTVAPVEPTATAEAEMIAYLTAEDFGDNINPLTGEEVDPAKLQRRPLVVKISNAPPSYVRPQSGLNDADIVFEHITEGRLTRFTMLLYGNDPEKVGPIRSARLVDVELPAMYDAALAFSGASVGVSQKLYRSDISAQLIGSGEQGYYRTGEDKPFEHTFYARPEGLRGALDAKGENRPPNFNGVMQFTSLPPEGGQSATTISIDYAFETVSWVYDAETNYYYRSAAGVPHNDGNTGEQVRARNIVVPFINHVDNAEICEEIRDDVCVALSVEIQLWGQGRVVIFRDGQQYEGTWKREGRNDILTFYDGSGAPMPLQIGNSWFELMSIFYNDPLQVEG